MFWKLTKVAIVSSGLLIRTLRVHLERSENPIEGRGRKRPFEGNNFAIIFANVWVKIWAKVWADGMAPTHISDGPDSSI